MSFTRKFETFDPLTGHAVSHPSSSLPDIVTRARRLLSGRTKEQIIDAAEAIEYFVDEYFDAEREAEIRSICEHGSWVLGYLPPEGRTEAGVRYLLENWPSEGDDQPPFIPPAENTTTVEALKACIDTVTPDSEILPDGQEFEPLERDSHRNRSCPQTEGAACNRHLHEPGSSASTWAPSRASRRLGPRHQLQACRSA